MTQSSPRLAVFDLDGTLTRRDTFGGFMVRALLRWPWRLVLLPRLLIPTLHYLLGRRDRGELKGGVMHALLAGLTREQVRTLAASYVARVMRSQLHEEVPGVLAAHRAAGDHLVLMSASPDLYVPLLGQALGFDEVLCTEVRWNGDRLDGRLAGPNCRDRDKTRRLAELRARHPGRGVIAYGNSAPDVDHLRTCEQAVYVNARPAERAELEALGMTLVQWH